MANKDLKGHKFHIDDSVKPVCEKYGLFTDGTATYENLKKVKSEIENGVKDIEGEDKKLILGFIDKRLSTQRDSIQDSKDIQSDIYDERNVHRKEHEKTNHGVGGPSIYKLTESQISKLLLWKKEQTNR